MGWKYRKGKPYYYRSERIGNKVVSRYLGCGAIAFFEETIGELRVQRRQQEAMERQIARSELAELATTPPEVVAVLSEARRATREALEAAGYHQHDRGAWRKKRHAKKES